MLLNYLPPAAHLQRFVRLYRIVDFSFGATDVIPVKWYSPRPEVCLQFYPHDRETVQQTSESAAVSNNGIALIGQHTTINLRSVGRRFLCVQVIFQPTAFARLYRIDMPVLANTYMDADAVVGTAVHEVNEQLFEARSYEQMIAVVETYLTRLVNACTKESRPLDDACLNMLHQENYTIDHVLLQSCLSHRQFDRNFTRQVGIPPKEYLRIIRFDQAFRYKNRFPHMDWLTVALHCGYHDYQHLVRDYKAFTGYTPVQFSALDGTAPERIFGHAEL